MPSCNFKRCTMEGTQSVLLKGVTYKICKWHEDYVLGRMLETGIDEYYSGNSPEHVAVRIMADGPTEQNIAWAINNARNDAAQLGRDGWTRDSFSLRVAIYILERHELLGQYFKERDELAKEHYKGSLVPTNPKCSLRGCFNGRMWDGRCGAHQPTDEYTPYDPEDHADMDPWDGCLYCKKAEDKHVKDAGVEFLACPSEV